MTVGNVYVDLICMLEPIDEEATVVFNNFDFGICRVARRNGKNILSQDFKNDRDNKTLTFLDTSRDHEDMRRVTQDHLQRLKDKFPTYTVKGLEDYE